LPFDPFESASAVDFTPSFLESRVRPNKENVLFAVIDKRQPAHDGSQPLSRTLAGIISLLNTSPTDLMTEMGFTLTFPALQGTHVTKSATALLLCCCLDPSPVGLGLRRVQWQANIANQASIHVAERMRSTKEAVRRWDRVVPADGKVGNGRRIGFGDPKGASIGRDIGILSIYWDDWEERREFIQGVRDVHFQREVKTKKLTDIASVTNVHDELHGAERSKK
ncbi:hypothetical protein GLOTRDRAFT_46029, partial [Gloeophyllum trabeum ATCC 11539]